jgi:hypothetical protein
MVSRMSKAYRCPTCQNEVDRGATVCSNPDCRRELAFCSHCRDVTTYTLAQKAHGRLGRDRYRCDRCQRVGVKCITWMAGGYCNGLARATDGRPAAPLCANCAERTFDVGRSLIGGTLIWAIGGLLKKRPRG